MHSIAIVQEGFFTEAGQYSPDFDRIGFELPAGTRLDASTIQGPYYTYTLTALPLGGIPNGNFRATATGDIDPSDPVLDIIIIETQLTVIGE